MTIRQLDWQADYPGMRICVVALQQAERAMDHRMPRGEDIVDQYLTALKQDCQRYSGRILVVEVDQEIVGYVCLHCRYRSGSPYDGPDEYGYISDLVIRTPWRGRGYATTLIETAEQFARTQQVKWLRIGVLASNTPALALYRQHGFHDHELQLEKPLD